LPEVLFHGGVFLLLWRFSVLFCVGLICVFSGPIPRFSLSPFPDLTYLAFVGAKSNRNSKHTHAQLEEEKLLLQRQEELGVLMASKSHDAQDFSMKIAQLSVNSFQFSSCA